MRWVYFPPLTIVIQFHLSCLNLALAVFLFIFLFFLHLLFTHRIAAAEYETESCEATQISNRGRVWRRV